MYSNPIYYILLTVSFLSFIIYVSAVYKNKEEIKSISFIDTTVLDNRVYWVYNNSLYYGNLVDQTIDKKSITTVETFGMEAEEVYKMFKVSQ